MMAKFTARARIFGDMGAGGGEARVARATVMFDTNVVAISATGGYRWASIAGSHVVHGAHMCDEG